MMTAFILSAVLLTVITLALLYFLWRRQCGEAQAISRRKINAAIYRDQLAELERDRQEGLLAEQDYQSAVDELERRLLEEGNEPTSASATPQTRPTLSVILPLFIGLPLGAVLLYLVLGQPSAIDAPPAQPRFTAEEIDAMVAKLAARLEREPDNLHGWVMLARSYKVLGRFVEAAQAYERASTLLAHDASLLVDYADVLATVHNSLAGKPTELLARAMQLEPDHPQGLWLSGAAAFEAGRYDEAIARWERLLSLLPPGSEQEAASLREGIDEARQRKQADGKR